MPKDLFDFTNYKETQSDHLPEGSYPAVISYIDKVRTRADDAWMYNVAIEIDGGEFSGATIIDRLVQKETALFRTASFLRGMGVNVKRKRFQLDMQKFVGKRITVEVADSRPRQGYATTSEVRTYSLRKAAAAAVAEAEPEDLDEAVETADGADEFAEETTQNPSDEVSAARQRKQEPQAEEPERVPAAKEPKVAEPEPEADEVDVPETVDLDDIEL